MKKLALAFAFLFSITVFSQGIRGSYRINNTQQQNYRTPSQLNEIKIDGAKLAIGGILEASYEFVGNNSSGYGISVLVNPRESDAYFEKFSITPFYRMYFLNRQDYGAKGLFIEGFSKFSFGTDDNYYYDNYGDDEYFDTALGLSIGKKWVNNNGFILEIFAGGGRTLGMSEASPEGFFRGGIFIGKRF
ncbi:hypothetical protein [Lutibacter citreus]|uniref:hypothetical protein n=1 Tax=Lutibacter citreus TaxID=2138210 RepID=UPI000DBE7939|nr:hypothetical protein [Lutibacter citreus]